ncbi:DNA-binding transcriptional LysR family regulator [Chitinophaga polysaccharea]|uniref:DNA-binding transcriptional LysR family regulator n=1 Tax=Chitinophaga polysaccharea TaxID=1293035 RepID=A0A561PP11_9BACT|nr:LysR family transcriptional regulator [Chitinophaga polysaccharea]TWF39828.1 DNA-binding transcriptional LysR family regulator [Chitinophaga polysaccharea]
MVNLEWYRTFKAVYQTGSLTAASKMLFISQPNVSQHLSALEAYVGKPLFDRKPKIVPTDYGKLFYTQVVEPLEKLENVETDFRYLCSTKEIPNIHLGTVKEFFQAQVACRISTAPANFVVDFDGSKDLVRRLRQQDFDFAVVTEQIEEKNITYESILTEHFVVVAHAGLDTRSFKAHLKKNDLARAEAWLLEQTWFANSSDLPVIRRFWRDNFRKRPALQPKYIIPDISTIVHAISYGDGITIAAEYMVKEAIKSGLLKEVWRGVVPAYNTVYLAYEPGRIAADRVKIMHDLLRMQHL